jgi:hypothetical protein
MPKADTIQPISFGKYAYISQQEFDLTTLSLEVSDDNLVLVFPTGDKRPITEKGFQSLCQLIQVPLSFAKRLKEDGNTHVLQYLQKQMSAAYLRELAIVVCDTTNNHVLSVTSNDKLLPSFHAVVEMDKDILKAAETFAKANLTARFEDDAYLRYGFMTKRSKPLADDSEYEFGHVFAYSLYGYEQPHFYQVAVRLEDMSVLVLPFKPEYLSTTSTSFFGDLISKVETLGTEGWGDLEGFLARMKAVRASLREVKETRQRLIKTLKVDKEDTETEQRMEEFFGWKTLVQKYEIRSLDPKPSKRWFMSAPSHLNLLDIYKKLVCETTHAPNTLEADKRLRLQKYATKMLGKQPDMAEKEPPKGVV